MWGEPLCNTRASSASLACDCNTLQVEGEGQVCRGCRATESSLPPQTMLASASTVRLCGVAAG